MRRLIIALMLPLALAACGSKKPPVPPNTPEPPQEPPPMPEPVPEPTPGPDPDPTPKPPESNASFEASIQHANGTVTKGHVMRVDRGEDTYAETGWTDSPNRLTVELSQGNTALDAKWDQLADVTIGYGAKGDVDCMYDSSMVPWMYMCTLRTTSTAKTTDGKSWTVDSRYKWQFTFSDGTTESFYLSRLPAREQDSAEPTLDGGGENNALYAKLQAKVVTDAGSAVTKITITH